jgi:hypothetical protein
MAAGERVVFSGGEARGGGGGSGPWDGGGERSFRVLWTLVWRTGNFYMAMFPPLQEML